MTSSILYREWKQYGPDVDISGLITTTPSLVLSPDGTRVAVYQKNGTKVRVFRVVGGNHDWIQYGSDITTSSGISDVSLSKDGTSIIIGESGYVEVTGDPPVPQNLGSVVTYDYQTTDWVQYGFRIKGPPGKGLGHKIFLSHDGQYFTSNASQTFLGATQQGSIWCYRRAGAVWALEQTLVGDNNAAGFGIGYHFVSILNDIKNVGSGINHFKLVATEPSTKTVYGYSNTTYTNSLTRIGKSSNISIAAEPTYSLHGDIFISQLSLDPSILNLNLGIVGDGSGSPSGNLRFYYFSYNSTSSEFEYSNIGWNTVISPTRRYTVSGDGNSALMISDYAGNIYITNTGKKLFTGDFRSPIYSVSSIIDRYGFSFFGDYAATVNNNKLQVFAVVTKIGTLTKSIDETNPSNIIIRTTIIITSILLGLALLFIL